MQKIQNWQDSIKSYMSNHVDANFTPKKCSETYGESLVKLKDVDVVHGQASAFQDLWSAVCWSGEELQGKRELSHTQQRVGFHG